jgi:AcrR family transcriptional regulator
VVGRGRKVQEAVHTATLAELAEKGYADLTVDGVAHRAGVHKTTVYRRWKDRESLVVDTLSTRYAVDIPTPDTGSLAGDLRELARALVAEMTGPTGAAVRIAMHTDAGRLPEIAETRRKVFADRIRRATPVVERAVERGEVPPDTDPAAVFTALAAPIHFRLLVTGEAVDQETADQAAEVVLLAARAGVLRSTGRGGS